jgi:MFS family permease
MKLSRIQKLYVSNLLTGLIFWFGIEKLFMRSIGINAIGIGIATSAFLIFGLLFDIPAGILADKWSRKGVLVISALGLAVSSVLMGSSHGLWLYVIGELFFGIYMVCSSGTYNAIIYDTLYEDGMADQYSKIAGRAYALFLASAGIANIASGFLAHSYGYRFTYFITVISCLLNILLILTISEPKFHKAENKERTLHQIKAVSRTLSNIKLVRVLVIVLTALTVSELFKSEFGQLYMLRYFTSPQIIGLLWAVFAFTWSLGSLIAHRFRAKINALAICTVVPFVIMSFIDNWFSLVLFMFQAIAAAAFINQIETQIQENTPSAVRTSILSAIYTVGRVVSVPASFVLGWLFRDYNALVALRFVAVVSAVALIYWLWAGKGIENVSRGSAGKSASPSVP